MKEDGTKALDMSFFRRMDEDALQLIKRYRDRDHVESILSRLGEYDESSGTFNLREHHNGHELIVSMFQRLRHLYHHYDVIKDRAATNLRTEAHIRRDTPPQITVEDDFES